MKTTQAVQSVFRPWGVRVLVLILWLALAPSGYSPGLDIYTPPKPKPAPTGIPGFDDEPVGDSPLLMELKARKQALALQRQQAVAAQAAADRAAAEEKQRILAQNMAAEAMRLTTDPRYQIPWHQTPPALKQHFFNTYGNAAAGAGAAWNSALTQNTGRTVESFERGQPPTPAIDDSDPTSSGDLAVITTSAGDMLFQFWPETAPNTVANFITLAKRGFYDGTAFHRIIKGFMIQGGDPLSKYPSQEAKWGTGTGNVKLKAEFSDRKHEFGVLSMARSADPDSGSCQFFICLGPTPQLDGKYACFGKLIKGEDVLKKLGDTPVGASAGGEPSRPLSRVGIHKIVITRSNSTPGRPPVAVAGSQPAATGTGFLITADGFVVTNAHVVKGGTKFQLVTSAGSIAANVVKVDSANDLALLKAEGSFAALPVVTSRAVRLGSTVATVGFPNIGLQGFAPKLAKGEIAALSGVQDDVRYFQISVPVQPGNSGGALVDERGNVVGIVSAKLSAKAALDTSGALPENVNYAVKSSFLLGFLESMPAVAAKLKEPNTKDEKFEEAVKSAEQSTVLVLVY